MSEVIEEKVEVIKPRWPDNLRVVKSDDFSMTVDGVKYWPHQGETVTLRPKFSAQGLKTVVQFAKVVQSGITADRLGEYSDALADACELLASNIESWTWTGPDGRGYPPPKNNAKFLASLHVEELLYLLTQYQEPGAVSKN
jgi:hypothetical protein